MNTACAHIIDDDEAIRDALQWQFRTRGLACRLWPSAEAFLAAWQPDWSGCIVLDIRMQGMSGLECFDALRARDCRLPVIFITGHGDVLMAVSALKKGPSTSSKNPSMTTNCSTSSRKRWRPMPNANAPREAAKPSRHRLPQSPRANARSWPSFWKASTTK